MYSSARPGLAAAACALRRAMASVRRRRDLHDLARQLVCSSRKRLPSWLGGRLDESDLQLRLLDPSDAWRSARLIGAPVENEHLRLGRLSTTSQSFAAGAFLRRELVAHCCLSPMWAFLGIPGSWSGSHLVRADLRGRGVGQTLFRFAAHQAQRRGVERIYVSVQRSNVLSLGSVKAAGFVEIDAPQWSAAICDYFARIGAPAHGGLTILCKTIETT